MSAAQSLATESTTPLYFEIETLFCPKPEGAENTEVVEMQNSDSAWLSGVRNDLGVHHYVYDHKGERVMKSSVMHSSVQINDQNIDDIEYLEPYTLYINPYYVVTELKGGDKVSKHYYMNTQRVATDISINYQVHEPMAGPQQPNARDPKKPSEDTASVNYNAAFADLQATLNALGHQKLEIDQLGEQPTLEEYYPELVSKPSQNSTMAAKNAPESTTRILFWYHPDYLGNVDLVTERDGRTYEFFTYNPWGEEMHQYNANTFGFSSPYRFNSKEKDAETGLHYYGARYYQSKLSLWMSVDPLAHETLEPYIFTGNNPINAVDPDGRAPNVPNCCGGNPLLYLVTGLGQDLEAAYDKFEFEAGKAYDATISFVNDLFNTSIPPTGADLMNQSSNKAVKKVGNAVDFVDKVKDAGEMIMGQRD